MFKASNFHTTNPLLKLVVIFGILHGFRFRYDVELFQRIEQLIGQKMPLFQTNEEEVMQLQERVSEAQRLAAAVRVG